jgi:hypothetical protein
LSEERSGGRGKVVVEEGDQGERTLRREPVYWLIEKIEDGPTEMLTVGLHGGQQALSIFSHREEAEMFLWLQTTEDGREVRETTPGQLVSILYGPCADVGRVMLDPLPEIGARVQISLLGMDRNDFVRSAMGARSLDSHISPRTAQCESPGRSKQGHL